MKAQQDEDQEQSEDQAARESYESDDSIDPDVLAWITKENLRIRKMKNIMREINKIFELVN